CTRGAYW
nr:immunoglobulin heavy chain junction region [Mus musculus]